MKFFAQLPEKEFVLELDGKAGALSVKIDDEEKKAELHRIGTGNVFLLLVDNRCHELSIEPRSDGYAVRVDGRLHRVRLESEQARNLRKLIRADDKSHGKVEIRSPMPGLVLEINVEEGQQIKVGDSLLVIEAMKMENEIRADVAGKVTRILKKAKDSVEKDAVLMTIE